MLKYTESASEQMGQALRSRSLAIMFFGRRNNYPKAKTFAEEAGQRTPPLSPHRTDHHLKTGYAIFGALRPEHGMGGDDLDSSWKDCLHEQRGFFLDRTDINNDLTGQQKRGNPIQTAF